MKRGSIFWDWEEDSEGMPTRDPSQLKRKALRQRRRIGNEHSYFSRNYARFS
jgi:hypothetical protein